LTLDRFGLLASLEELYGALVLFGSSAAAKRTEVAALARAISLA
jgi:hypothetical protein